MPSWVGGSNRFQTQVCQIPNPVLFPKHPAVSKNQIDKCCSVMLDEKEVREESTEEMNLTLWKRCSTSVGASEAHLKRCQNAVSRLGRPTDIQTVGSTLARPRGNGHFYLLLEALWDEE